MRAALGPMLVAWAMAACQGSRANVAAKRIDQVLAEHRDSLLALPGVVGTAVALCDGERCIKVLLADSNPDTRGRIPDRLEGYRVVVEVTGPIRPR